MQKDFNDWNFQKKGVHHLAPRPFYHEREVWWCSLGVNIGYEEDGKHNGHERPVIVFKKFNKQVFWALPVTTRAKSGRYYFTYTRDGFEFAVILSQIRLLDAKRLKRKILTLTRLETNALNEKFAELLT